MSKPINVTESDFEEMVEKSNIPVMVDFWAEWCGPCKMLSPTIDALALEYYGKASIGKLNVDNSSDIATKYGIRSIPCLLFFKDGEVHKQIVGAIEKSEISSILDNL